MQNQSWQINGLKELEAQLKDLGAAVGIKALRKAGRDSMAGFTAA